MLLILLAQRTEKGGKIVKAKDGSSVWNLMHLNCGIRIRLWRCLLLSFRFLFSFLTMCCRLAIKWNSISKRNVGDIKKHKMDGKNYKAYFYLLFSFFSPPTYRTPPNCTHFMPIPFDTNYFFTLENFFSHFLHFFYIFLYFFSFLAHFMLFYFFSHFCSYFLVKKNFNFIFF